MVISLALVFLIIASQAAAKAAQPMVAGGCAYTVGLKSDGTVVAVGYNEDGQCSLFDWNLLDFADVPQGYWAEEAIYKIY